VLIPQGVKHRIENKRQEKVVFIEVQTGTYFGEDDIVRIEDDYNRA
jgi:mannose-6-phosphate isomerase-like protein (cupin superfamily)